MDWGLGWMWLWMVVDVDVGIAVGQTDRKQKAERRNKRERGGVFFCPVLVGWLAGWGRETRRLEVGGGGGGGLKLPGLQPVFFCLRVGLVWFGLVWSHGLSSPLDWTGLDWTGGLGSR